MKINAGCEHRPSKDSLNIDISSNSKADLIADIEVMPIRDNVIEEIYCMAVFEHLESPIRVLREFKRVIRKKGLIKIGVPNIHIIDRIAWNLKDPLNFRSTDPTDNVAGFDPKILNNIFTLTGFKSVKYEYFTDPYFWGKRKSIFKYIVPFIPGKLWKQGLMVSARSVED